MTAHALFGASSSHRWLHCPGSLKASEHIPSTTSPAADRGSMLHASAEAALRSEAECPEEVAPYVEWVRALPGRTWLETRVLYGKYINQPDDVAFGTADCINLSPDGTILTVGDLKTGAMRVDPVDNPQLVLYAFGAAEFLDLIGHDVSRITTLRLVILQPRIADNPVVWETTPAEQLDLLERLAQAATFALVPEPPRHATAEACRWCPAKITCPELKAAVAVHAAMFRGVAPTAFEPIARVLAPAMLRTLYETTAVVRIWCDAIDAEMNSATARGEPTGYKFVEGRKGHRRYTDVAQVETVLSRSGLSAKEWKTAPELLSPAQLEKALRSHKSVLEEVAPFVVAPQGKPTLVPTSDPRPVFVEDRAARIIESFTS